MKQQNSVKLDTLCKLTQKEAESLIGKTIVSIKSYEDTSFTIGFSDNSELQFELKDEEVYGDVYPTMDINLYG